MLYSGSLPFHMVSSQFQTQCLTVHTVYSPLYNVRFAY